MAKRRDITLTVGYELDDLKKELSDLASFTRSQQLEIGIDVNDKQIQKQMKRSKEIAEDIEYALTKAYNPKLDSINIKRFNKELGQSKVSLVDIGQSFSRFGAQGERAYAKLTSVIGSTNKEIKKQRTFLDELGTTFGNTVKYNISNSAFQAITDSVKNAYGYVRALDNSLNDIRIVTGYSAEQMDKFAVSANKAAKALGRSTVEYTDASVLFYQMGLNDEEVEARTNLTMKVANTSGLGTEESAEYITAVLNGYKVAAEGAEKAMDVLSLVGAETAASLSELAEGMSKVASSANAMGVSQEQLASTLATVISVTRQDAGVVGTAFKTIYARISDIEAGTADAEISLGDYTSQMKAMGFDVLDATGHLRDTGEVIEEIGYKWQDLTREQQVSLAQTMAGTRQYNNLVALFDNWDAYVKTLNDANNATGTLNKQNEIFLDSVQAKLNQLQATTEDLYNNILNDDAVKSMIEGITSLVSAIDTLIESMGGIAPMLTIIGGLGASVFGRKISQGVINARDKLGNAQTAKDRDIGIRRDYFESSINGRNAKGDNADFSDKSHNLIDSLQIKRLENEKYLDDESFNLTEQSFKGVLDSFTELNIGVKEVSDILKNNTDGLSDTIKNSMGDFAKAYEEEILRIEELALKGEKIEISDSFKSAYENFNKTMSRSANRNTNYAKKLENLKLSDTDALDANRINNIKKGLGTKDNKELADAILQSGFDEETTKQYLNDLLDELINGAVEKAQRIIEAQAEISDYDLSVQDSKTSPTLRNLDNNSQRYSSSSKDTDTIAKLEAAQTVIGELTSTIGLTVGGIQSLGVVFNDAATPLERMVAGVSALGMGLSALNNIKKLNGPLTTLIEKFNLSAAAGKNTFETVKNLTISYGAYGAAAAVLIGTIAAVVAWENKEENAIKKTAEAAKEAEEAFNSLEASRSTFQSDKENYEAAVKELSNLTKGTAEYEEALKRANEAAENLTSSSPELSQQSKVDFMSGATVFNEGALDEFEKKYKEAVDGAHASALNAQVKNFQARINKIYSDSDVYSTKDGYITFDETVSKVSSLVEDSGLTISQAIQEVGIVDSLENNTDKLEESVSKVIELKNSIDNLNTQIVGLTFGKDEDYQGLDSSQQSAFNKLVNNNTDVDKYIKNNSTWLDKIFKNEEELFNQYAELIGGEVVDRHMNSADIKMKDGTVTSVGQDQAYNSVIKNEALLQEGIKESALTAVNAISDFFEANGLSKTNGLYDEILKATTGEAISGGLSQISPDDILVIVEKLKEIEGLPNAEEFKGLIDAAAEQHSASDYWGHQAASQKADAGAATRAITTFNTNDTLTEQDVTALKERYEELGDIQNQNSAEFLSSLIKIRDAEYDNYQASLQQQRDILKTRIDTDNLTIEQIKEIKSQIADIDREITISIKTEIDNDINSGFAIAQEYENLAGLLTENYRITAEQAQEYIKNGYGAILESSYVAADNLIQLNAEVVNKYIDGQQAEMDAARQAKVDELSLEKESLKAQLTILDSKEKTLREALSREGSMNKIAAIAKAQLEQASLEAAQSRLVGEVESQDKSNKELTASQEKLYNELFKMYDTDSLNEQKAYAAADDVAKQHAENVVSYYVSMGQAVENYAKTVKSNGNIKMKDVEVGGVGIVTEAPDIEDVVSNYEEYSIQAVSEIANNIREVIASSGEATSEEATSSLLDAFIEKELANLGSYRESIEAQIGAIDGSINAMYATGKALDTLQANMGRKSNGKDAETIDALKDILDIYHDINIEISNQERSLNKLQKAQEKTHGAGLIKNLNAQLALIEKQKKSYKEKLRLTDLDMAAQQKQLSKYGARFDAEGQLINYEYLHLTYLQKVNEETQRYNSLSQPMQDERAKKRVEDAKKEYEEVKKLVEAYDNLVTTIIPEVQEAIDDLSYQEIELKITKFNLRLEVSLDLSEAERNWNEFRRRVIEDFDEDDLLGSATQLIRDYGTYYQNEIGVGTEQLSDTLEELRKLDRGELSDVYSSGDVEADRAKAIEDLKSHIDTVTNALIELENEEDRMNQLFLSSIDNIKSAYEEEGNIYKFFNNQLTHSIRMVELMYGDEAYKQMSDYYDKQVKMDSVRVSSLRDQEEYWRTMMNEAASIGDDDAYNKYLENWKGTVEELNSEIETWAENTVKRYENTISSIFEDLNNQLSGGLGLKYINEEFELLQKNADNYLDAINSAYGVQNLENKWQESINGASNEDSQKALTQAMTKQLTLLKQKGQLTQRDIDRAEKEYQIVLKQIVLREQEMNKTQMRLKRDANGNYTYQFVSDLEEVGKAQAELQKAQNELYNFDKETYNNNLNEIYTIWNEYQEKTKEAYIKYKDDEEERERYLQLLREQYGERINFLTEENNNIRADLNNSAFENLAILYQEDLTKFKDNDFEKSNSLALESAKRLGITTEEFTTAALKYQEDRELFKNNDFEKSNSLALESAKRLSITTEEFTTAALKYQEDRELFKTLDAEKQEAFKASWLERTGLTEEEFNQYVLDRNNDYTNYVTTLNSEQEAFKASWLERTGLTEKEFNQYVLDRNNDYTNYVTTLNSEKEAFSANLAERMGLSETNVQNLANNYNKDKMNFESMIESEKNAIITGLVPTWTSGVQTMSDKITAEGGLSNVMSATFTNLNNAARNFKSSMDSIGATASNIIQTVNSYQKTLTESSNTAVKKAIEESNAIKSVKASVDNLKNSYQEAKKAAIEAATASMNYWTTQQEIARQQAEAERAAKEKANSPSGSSSSSSSNSSSAAIKKVDNSSKAEGVAAAIWIMGSDTSGWLDGQTRTNRLNAKGVVNAQSIINSQGPNGELYRKWGNRTSELKKYYYGAFERGGYTGNWRDGEGRPFLLHPKEAVLNKDDTSNLFKIVDIARDIAQSINLNMLSKIKSPTLATTTNNMHEFTQKVNINANFPDVRDSQEIQNAFNNLLNIAAQRANRNTRE